MFTGSRKAVAAAVAITLAAVCTASATAADLPERGVRHFVLNNSAPSYYNPKVTTPVDTTITSKVDLSANDTEGRYTVQDEIWNAGVTVPLHYHKRHAEVFYIVSGEVEWTVGGETHLMHGGDVVYIPPNTPHKVHVVGGKPMHDLFIFAPGGYEDELELQYQFTPQQLKEPVVDAVFSRIRDFHPLPDATVVKPDTLPRGQHHFTVNGGGRSVHNPSSTGVDSKIMLSGDDTEGRYTLQDEVWNPHMEVPLHFHKRHAETFYILSGQVEWTVGGETHVMSAGDLVYIPVNTPHKVHVVGDKPLHTLFVYQAGGYEDSIDIKNKFSEAQLKEPATDAAMSRLHDFNPLPEKK